MQNLNGYFECFGDAGYYILYLYSDFCTTSANQMTLPARKPVKSAKMTKTPVF